MTMRGTVTEDKWRIEIDTAACARSGVCTGLAPAHFTVGDDHAHATQEYVEPDENVRDAASLCPMAAIRLYGADGDELEV